MADSNTTKTTTTWEPDRPLSRADHEYLVDLLTSVMGQITYIKRRINILETDLAGKLDKLHKLPHE